MAKKSAAENWVSVPIFRAVYPLNTLRTLCQLIVIQYGGPVGREYEHRFDSKNGTSNGLRGKLRTVRSQIAYSPRASPGEK